MTARFRPEGDRKPRAARFRSDPPPGVPPSLYYRDMLVALPKTVAALITSNVWALVRQELGSNEAVAEWLADVVARRGASVLLHLGDRTIAIGPGTREQLLGFVGVHHGWLEDAFGPIARVDPFGEDVA